MKKKGTKKMAKNLTATKNSEGDEELTKWAETRAKLSKTRVVLDPDPPATAAEELAKHSKCVLVSSYPSGSLPNQTPHS